MAKIMTANPDVPSDLLMQEAAGHISKGAIVIYPTETFYGIGALYSDEKALKRIFQLKQRDFSKPLLLLIPDFSSLDKLLAEISNQALLLAKHFWPGPLTLVLPAATNLSLYVTGGGNKIGLRISSHPVVARLLHFLKKPITSTSANLSGGENPTRIEDIPQCVVDAVDLVIDTGETTGGLPSTICDVSSCAVTILRAGAVSSDALEQCLAKTPSK